MTATDLDFQVFEDLKFDATCEVGDCDRSARWVGRHGTSCITLMCDKCKAASQSHVKELLAKIRRKDIIVITKCKICRDDVDLDKITFTPLEK